MKQLVILLIPVFLIQQFSYSQMMNIEWQRSIGGSSSEEAKAIQQTTDGGYIVAGYSLSNDGDVSGNHGLRDFWIVKLDMGGNMSWQKSLGGSLHDQATSIQQTTDGGYIVAGRSLSNDGDVTGNHGFGDFWIVKLDMSGNISWQNSLGGSSYDEANSIQQTTDGGYIVAGLTESNDGDVSGIANYNGFKAYWIVKLDMSGNISWQKSLGGGSYDAANSIQQTTDGGYIVAGRSQSNDGDVSENNGSYDYWIVKLDMSGNISWQNSLGGSFYDEAKSIKQTTDGGYIVAGRSRSNDGDITENHGIAIFDYWIVKLDMSGNISWQRCLGGSLSDEAKSIQQTTDGGYIVAGWTDSNDGDISENNGGYDSWIVKLDMSGNISWKRSLGGSSHDGANSIQQTTDGGYIVAGWAQSNDGDVTGNHGFMDFWVVKLGNTSSTESFLFEKDELYVYPNPTNNLITIESEKSINKDFKIFDQQGRVVILGQLKGVSTEVSLGNLSRGTYTMQVEGNFKPVVIVKE